MEQKYIFCCEEHTDMAFDDFLVYNETFPNFVSSSLHKCSYCENNAKYVLELPKNVN